MAKKLIRITTVPMALKYLLGGQMKFMRENGFEVIAISADGKEIKDIIEREECRHIIVPMTRRITPLQDFKCLIQLIRVFKKERPDIVHTHTPKAGLLGMIAAKVIGVKVRIHTVAGLPLMVEHGLKYRVLKIVEQITYFSATQIWPNSHSLKQFILTNKLTFENKIKVIGNGSSNGIDISRFNRSILDDEIMRKTKVSVNYLEDAQYLLYTGRLVVDKGIIDLMLVFREMEMMYPNLRLILVGQYEQEFDPLPSWVIEQIESNSRIIHIDWSDKVEYFMAVSNLFVFPSYREGFPNVILQAGSMYLPIVCSNIGGNIEIIKKDITGLLFEVKNKNDLKDKLEFALNNPDMMKKMAVNLAGIINSAFRREIIWELILKQYQTLLYLKN